jgi:hypothetical protein
MRKVACAEDSQWTTLRQLVKAAGLAGDALGAQIGAKSAA